MRKLLTWLAGGLGVAALARQLLRRQPARPPAYPPAPDPAEELRAKLEQAREAVDDRDEFDAAEGTPVDEVEARPAEAAPPVETPPVEAPATEPPSSLEERRRRVHDKAQEALGQMRSPDDED